MNRLFEILLTTIMAVIVAATLCGCLYIYDNKRSSVEVVNEVPIDTRYTESHQEIVTDYDYQYDFFSGEGFRLMPNTHTAIIPDKYEVQYRVYYDNCTNDTEWREVARDEYEATLKLLDEQQEEQE